MAKYKNYKELSEAFKAGEMSPHHFVRLDKGGTENSLCYYNPDGSDEENEEKGEECSELFEGTSDGDYAEAEALFEALEIPTRIQ